LFCARRTDGTAAIKVLDFGISKLTGGAGAGSMAHTKTTAIMGSPFYMSPEQMESTRGVDARTDIWGLGVILFELVTGKTPFEGSALPEICLRVATQAPPSMRMLRSDAPAALELVILRCLEKDRDKRYGTVARLAVALRDFASPRGRQSIETILRTTESAGQAVAMSAAPAAAPPPGDGSRTMDPLGRTQIPLQGAKGKTLVAAAAGVVVLGVVGFVALRAMSSPAPAPSATLVQAAANSTTAAVAAPALAADPAPAPVESPTPAEPVATAAPPPAPVAVAAKKPAAGAPMSPAAPGVRSPAKSKSNCDPNFYLDAQGEKHFKPECFR
jgi:serine/threonine-protein kinase